MRQITVRPKEGENNTQVDLDGLQGDHSYLVQMWASTAAGPGQTSVAVVVPASSSLTSVIVIAIAGSLVVALVVSGLVSTVCLLIVMKCQQKSQSR